MPSSPAAGESMPSGAHSTWRSHPVVLVGLILLLLGNATLPLFSPGRPWVRTMDYLGVFALGFWAAGLAWRRARREGPSAFVFLGFGAALGGLRYAPSFLHNPHAALIGPAISILSVLALGAGLLLWPQHTRMPRDRVRATLDGITIALAIFIIAWLAMGSLDGVGRVPRGMMLVYMLQISACLGVMGLWLLQGASLRLPLQARERSFVRGAVLALLCHSFLVVLLRITGRYGGYSGHGAEVLCQVANVLVALAALSPSAAEESTALPPSVPSTLRALVPTGVALLALLLVASQVLRPHSVAPPLHSLQWCSLGLLGIMVLRHGLLVLDFDRFSLGLEARVVERTRELETLHHAAMIDRQKLEESEARYRSILNASPDDITITDLTGHILLISPAALRMFGCEREDQFLGRPITDFIAPEDRDRAASNTALRLQGAKVGSVAYRGLRLDGSTFEMEANSEFIRDAEGKPTAMVFVVRDITERKRAQDALQTSESCLKEAQRLAHIGHWVVDHRTDQTFWSEELFRIHGLDPSQPPPDWAQFQKLLHPEDRSRVIATYEGHVREGLASFTTEYRALLVNGELRHKRVHVRTEFDPEGRPLLTLGTDQDITERKEAEEEQRRLQAQLQQAQKMESLGSLAGGVAHDMNNVLGAILGMASANLEAQPADSSAYRAFDTIIQAATRGGKMIKSLLGFARQSPAEEHELDMNEILLEEVRMLERTTLANVRLELDLASELRPMRGDASALTHAVMNLCVNAVDAMPDSGTLTLRTRNVDSDWIEVRVEDTGSGMPKEVLEKALDPFFTTKEVGKGTGLGLSMVYSTVKAHQGQVEIQSEPGHGTRVMMRFPVCEPQIRVPEAPAELPSAPSAGGLSVLLVDDDELIQSAMQAILEVLGHRVTAVLSGEAALAELAAGLQPDTVILDMNMPGLGGAGTLPRLRALNPTVPILLATGRVDQFATDVAGAHPFVTLLSKPFNMRDLRQHLEAVAQI